MWHMNNTDLFKVQQISLKHNLIAVPVLVTENQKEMRLCLPFRNSWYKEKLYIYTDYTITMW